MLSIPLRIRFSTSNERSSRERHRKRCASMFSFGTEPKPNRGSSSWFTHTTTVVSTTRTSISTMTQGGATVGDVIVPEEHLTLGDGAVGYFYGSPNFSVRNTGRLSHRPTSSPKISNRLRWTVNGLAMTACFLFSGILFGWAPLKMILIREGQFRGTCAYNDPDPCSNQLVEFNFIFTIAQFCLNLASLPVGFFLDYASKILHFTLAGLLTVRVCFVRNVLLGLL